MGVGTATAQRSPASATAPRHHNHICMELRAWPVAVALACGIFAAPSRLEGPLLYDDKAAILRNPVVIGSVPLPRVWLVDFWGENELSSADSHKSWRPLVTLSYRANYIMHATAPFGYHAVNAALHALVSGLVEPAALAAFGAGHHDGQGSEASVRVAAAVAAILFAVHPVHVEAVQNIVGRAELMMSAFFLLGFVGYAACARRGWPMAAIALALGLALCATLCKETGITLPAMCVLWDFLVLSRAHPQTLLHWIVHLLSWPLLRDGVIPRPTRTIFGCGSDANREASAVRAPAARPSHRGCFARCGALLLGGVLLGLWRLSLNGGTLPRFNAFENPAALHPQPLFRGLSVVWVWAEYCVAVVYPRELSCDWSYPALPPIIALSDPRLAMLGVFVGVWVALLLWAAALDSARPRVLMSLAFELLPFLLASNLITVVGTSKAERLLYLPSLGGCLLVGLAIGRLAECQSDGGATPRRPYQWVGWLRKAAALCVAAPLTAVLAQHCAWYADVWCDGVTLWGHAVQVQQSRPPWLRGGVTTHALAEYGMQLSWAGRQAEAAQVLERQVALCEADLRSRSWPTSGRLQAAGYAPLSIVYRLLNDIPKAVAIAERGLSVIRLSEGERAGAPDHDARAVAREAARCLAAKALAVFSAGQTEQGVAQMRQALQMGGSADAVVLALAKQLSDHIQAVGGPVGLL